VRAVQVDYLRSARFNDVLWVTAEIAERGRASLSFNQRVVRSDVSAAMRALQQPAVDELAAVLAEKNNLLCTGHVRIACLDAISMRPRAIPSPLLAEISRVG